MLRGYILIAGVVCAIFASDAPILSGERFFWLGVTGMLLMWYHLYTHED